MKIKLQCCNCHSADEKAGEQLYKIDGKIYCSICGMDALIGNGVKLSGYAGEEIEVEDD